jgi:hypothetical protein
VTRPLYAVIEDGVEYLERFRRFLGSEFRFERGSDLDTALALATGRAAAEAVAPAGAAAEIPRGLLFDLDFRRIPAEALVDEGGRAGQARSGGERQRLAEVQGILILRALRAGGVRLPALLFADLGDREQAPFLESSLAPLVVLPSSVGLPEIREHLRRMAGPR